MATNLKTTILNVDDHEAGRYARTRALRNAGFDVLEATSGAEALNLVTAKHPQLVLLDINLPDMSGYDVCRQIKDTVATSRIIVLHVSATFVKGSDQKRGLEGGADGYLTEPVEQEVLIATVNAYLRLGSTEEALRESEARFRAAFEDAPTGKALVNFSHRIFRANQALSEMLGYQPDELSALSIEDLVIPEEKEKLSSLLEQIFAGESDGGYRLDCRCLSKNGEMIWVSLTGSTIRNMDGQILYGFVMVENASERKWAEAERDRLLAAERRARKEAEAANQAKDQFLATVSHELRTPLGAILGWTRILRSQSADAQMLARGLETIERNATAQAQLIEDILDVSRIISGKLRLVPKTVNLAAVVQAAVDSIKPTVEAKRIRLKTLLEAHDVSVKGDAGRLQQVVWNLLSNAVKFSSAGQEVQVGMKLVNSQVEIAVIDAGQGIPAAFLPHVFEPFRQADGSTSRKHGGLGIGLSIVRQLVELHGGTIEVFSDGEGKGATFRLRLPVADQQTEAETMPQSAEPAKSRARPELPTKLPRVLEGKKVLAVDDELDARELIGFILEMGGAKVELAASTDEALEVLQSWKPDIIVADIGMPVKDGYALIQIIRNGSRRDIALVPAIALTAYARAEERARALHAGFQAHMTKPVEPSELLSSIARVLEENRFGKSFGQSP